MTLPTPPAAITPTPIVEPEPWHDFWDPALVIDGFHTNVFNSRGNVIANFAFGTIIEVQHIWDWPYEWPLSVIVRARGICDRGNFVTGYVYAFLLREVDYFDHRDW